MLPSPAELQYFVEVAGTLNISRAAERLGISQPSLSLAIKRLEDAVGVPLLIRGKSGVNLTRTGRKFVGQARGLIAEWEKLKGEALKEESELSGRYSIGCHPAVALYTLPNFMPNLVATHSDLELTLVHGLSRQITDDVINFKVDFGLVVNPVEHPDLVIKLLARDEVSLWAGPGNSQVQNPSSGEAVLICDPDLMQVQALAKQFVKKGFHFRRTLTSASLEVITNLVARGCGVGILPGRVASRDKSLKLKPVPNSPKYQDRICLIYRADAQKSNASKAMAAVMSNCL